MARKAERERTVQGFCEGQAPEAAEAVGLVQAVFAAEAVKMDGAALASFTDVDLIQHFESHGFRQSALAAFATDLRLNVEPFLDVPRVQVGRDGLPHVAPADQRIVV